MKNKGKLEIKVFSYQKNAEELKEELESQLPVGLDDFAISVRPPLSRFRSVEPSVLVVVIGAVSGALAAFITGILRVSQQSQNKKIIIQSKDGAKLEIPADTPDEKIDHLVKKIREMDSPTFYL